MSDKTIIPGVNDGNCNSGSCDTDKKPAPTPTPNNGTNGVKNNHGCCNCSRIKCIPISNVEVTDTTLKFITNQVFTPINGNCYTIIVPCNIIPSMQSLLEVMITIDDNSYPLTDFTLGNLIYNDQIRCLNRDRCGNYVFRAVFGSNKPHFKIISQKLPKSLFEV